MIINKSETKGGVALSGVNTGDGSPVQVYNANYGSESYDNQRSGTGVILLVVIVVVVLTVLSARKSSEVEKWMDFTTAIQTFVPEDKENLDKINDEVSHLEEQLRIAKRNSALTAEMRGKIPPDYQKVIDDLQYKLSISKEYKQSVLDNIVQFLISKLKSGEIIAKGYDVATRDDVATRGARTNEQKLQWVCLLPSDWENGLQFSGTTTQTSITGARSGRTRLTSVRLGKPLAGAVPNPDRLCQG